eukprot:CAMPEP_0202685876 /NCGR_PEP_ID=MMETSP1385-20130828/1708_1 /ASSEMBLY_ACC=CAM_ASM_000861 /TAXON_ID=933848 /ORGANISM="Elphidium margaritaceum" /LENGTH=104 /DNA_ID=CAMNT_0049340345 /DNA_START=82 /DNA_END=396 /DNA_ORIENTATION=+
MRDLLSSSSYFSTASMFAKQPGEIALEPAPQVDPSNGSVIELSSNTMTILLGVLMVLLVLNLVIMSYNLCCASQRRKVRYQKVSNIASSDDDMRNLKEVEVNNV